MGQVLNGSPVKKHWVGSVVLCWLLGIATLPPLSGQEKSGDDDSNEVHRLFLADQADREGMDGGSFSFAQTTKLINRDKERRDRTPQIIASGGLKAGQDYHDAAFIFQHGDTSNDYLLAHILATMGVAKGDQESRWIAAATLDRYLQSIKQKQVFGTQYLKEGQEPYTREPYDRSLLSDAVRQTFDVKTQEEQQKTLEEYNRNRPTEKTVSKEISSLQMELKQLVDEDEVVRTTTPFSTSRVEDVNQKNYRELAHIYEKYGWPRISVVGQDASFNYWLLVQGQRLEFQEKVLPALQRAAEAGEAAKVNYAYLYDAVMVQEGKPQHWGTQRGPCKDSKATLAPVDDLAGLDQRRQELQLAPVEEYLKSMDTNCAPEAAGAPQKAGR